MTHKAGTKTRAATLLQLFHLIGKNSESHFPIGEQLCMTHIKQINKEIRGLGNNTLNDSIVYGYQIENLEALSFEDLEKSAQIQSGISSMLNVSLPSWQVKRKSIEDLSNNSVRSLKFRYKKRKCALKENLMIPLPYYKSTKTVINLGNWFHCLLHQKH